MTFFVNSRGFQKIIEMKASILQKKTQHVIINNYDLPAQSKTQSFTRPTYFGETLNPAAMFFLEFFLSVLS